MKKINLLLAVLFAAIISLNTGCKSEDPTGPTLDIEASTTSAWQGDTVVFTYSIASNADLESLTWTSTDFVLVDGSQEDEGTIELSGTSVQDETLTIVIKGNASAGDITFSFVATDKDGAELADEAEIVITVEEPAATTGDPIDTYTAVLMGAQDNATSGSFLATSTGQVYLTSAANANSSMIDIIFYYGSVNFATLCSPTDVTVNGGSGNLTLATGLTSQNATVLSSTSITASEFDAYDDDLEIAQLSVGSGTKVTQLAVGDVVSFKTTSDKIGLAKVTAVNGSVSGSITLTIKVQQ